MIDDAPQLGALRGAELLAGKLDPGLHDLTAPRLRARMDVFDGCVWHALVPRRAASGSYNATRRDKYLAGWRRG